MRDQSNIEKRAVEELDIATVDPMAKKAGKEFPGWLYGVLFVLFDAVGVAALQIGVSESATRVQLSNNMWLTGWGFVGKMFTSANFVAVLEPHTMGRPVCDSADAHQSFLGGHAGISGGDVHRRRD